MICRNPATLTTTNVINEALDSIQSDTSQTHRSLLQRLSELAETAAREENQVGTQGQRDDVRPNSNIAQTTITMPIGGTSPSPLLVPVHQMAQRLRNAQAEWNTLFSTRRAADSITSH